MFNLSKKWMQGRQGLSETIVGVSWGKIKGLWPSAVESACGSSNCMSLRRSEQTYKCINTVQYQSHRRTQGWSTRGAANQRLAELLVRVVLGWFRLQVYTQICSYSFRLDPSRLEINICGTERHFCFWRKNWGWGNILKGVLIRVRGELFVLLETMSLGHVILKCIYHLMLYVIWQNATGIYPSSAVVATWYNRQEICKDMISETLFKRTVGSGSAHTHAYHSYEHGFYTWHELCPNICEKRFVSFKETSFLQLSYISSLWG